MAYESIHSNAQNFPSFVNGAVDPRTGLYTFSVSLPSLRGGNLQAPDFSLALQFNPLSGNDWGLGAGWSPNLSWYDTTGSGVLHLGSGEQFATDSSAEEPRIPERKLRSFRFLRDSPTSARVIYRTGAVEHLRHPGYGQYLMVMALQAPSGHALHLEYEAYNGRPRLRRISDDEGGQVLALAVAGQDRITLSAGANTLELHFQNGLLRRLQLPREHGGEWAFGYRDDGNYRLIERVVQPLGAIETIEYGSQHAVPGNALPPLPRATRHEIRAPGDALLAKNEYRYGDDNHNFLGFGGVGDWNRGGHDNLYRASPTYQYEVTHLQYCGSEVRSTHRVYNSLHMNTKETVTQGKAITERITEFHLQPGQPFAAQPANFQLPRKVTTRWRLADDATAVRTETTESTFDSHGNPLREVNAAQQETLYDYYPAEGELAADGSVLCPPDPWGFKRHVRCVTELPAADSVARLAGDQRVTTYTYGEIAPITAVAHRPEPQGYDIQPVTLHTVAEAGGQRCSHTVRVAYHHSPERAGRYQHGRVSKRLEQLGGDGHVAAPIQETYRYALDRAQGVLRTHIRRQHEDGSDAVSEREQELASGLTTLSRGPEGTATRFGYDALQRLASSVVDDARFPATRSFEYRLVAGVAAPAEYQQTSATGVITLACHDALGRPVTRYRGTPGQTREQFTQLWQGCYDGFGRLAEETEYDDIAPGGATCALTTTHTFDDWGRECRQHLPNGTLAVTETTPFGTAGYCTAQWLESQPGEGGARQRQAGSHTELNAFGKPAWEELRLPDGSVEQRTAYQYDGWGQCLEQAVQYRRGGRLTSPEHTRFAYDPWGRLVSTTQPNGDVFLQGYAAHSREAWVSTLRYCDQGGALRKLASRTFDSLGRVVHQEHGRRLTLLRYKGAFSQPALVTHPDNTAVEYHYEPALGEAPTQVEGGQQRLRYTYNPVTAQLLDAEPLDSTGQLINRGAHALSTHYSYRADGELTAETRNDQGTCYTTTFDSSVGARPLSKTHTDAGSSHYHYDAAGRLEQEQVSDSQGQPVASAVLGYDAFGQLARITGPALATELHYDGAGRERTRCLLANGAVQRRYTHTYHGNGYLAARETYDGSGNCLLTETFEYDSRGRLTVQDNQGAEAHLPHDYHGKATTLQVYEFDALDNVTTLTTVYADATVRTASATFSPHDPCQLQRLTHTVESQQRASVLAVEEEVFHYDTNGRLTEREGGWRLKYDGLGRLSQLQHGGGQRRYRYDPQGTLCAVEDAQGEQHRFYHGYAVSHVQRGRQVQRYLATAGAPLALLHGSAEGALEVTELATDRAGSVVAEWAGNTLRTAIYDAYGNREASAPFTSELGFNGELYEGDSGSLYLLGRGYRLYDTGLMRFLAPDSASPFDGGGLNPYAYCRGNPVMLHDPTGHMPQWNAANLPYYVAPPEEQQGGGWLNGVFKVVGWVFLGKEAFDLLKLGAMLVAGTITGGLAVAAAAVSTVALGLTVWSMLDEDNDAVMYASIGVGVFAGLVSGAAMKGAKGLKGGLAQDAPAGQTPGGTVPRPSFDSPEFTPYFAPTPARRVSFDSPEFTPYFAPIPARRVSFDSPEFTPYFADPPAQPVVPPPSGVQVQVQVPVLNLEEPAGLKRTGLAGLLIDEEARGGWRAREDRVRVPKPEISGRDRKHYRPRQAT